MKFSCVFQSLQRCVARAIPVVAIVVALAGVSFADTSAPRDLEAEWKAIEGEAERAGFLGAHWGNGALRDKASERVESFVNEALAAEDYRNAFRGVVLRAGFFIKRYNDEESYFESVGFINGYRERMPSAFRAALDAVCALTWQDYCNREMMGEYSLDRRDTKGDAASRRRNMFAARKEIARLYALVLADATLLQQTPVGSLKGVLETGDYPEGRRPTLFDVITHQAIEFFTPKQDEVARDPFGPSPDGALLGSLEEFLAWRPEGSAVASSNLRALELFQTVMRFHQSEATRVVALADADLQRILWAKKILGDTAVARTRVRQALGAHLERWKDLDVSADTAAELAAHYWRSNSDAEAMREAYKMAALGIARHPESHGAERCRGMVAQLESRSVESASAEYVWNAPRPGITLTCRNIDRLHFRIVRAEWMDYLLEETESMWRQLLEKKLVVTWQAAFPKVDYVSQTHTVTVPGDLEPGFYFILGSLSEDFSAKENISFHLHACVSDITLASAIDPGQKGLSGFVMNSLTGDFVPDATVRAWRVAGSDCVELPSTRTDATGAFSFATTEPGRLRLLATAPNGHSVAFRRAIDEIVQSKRGSDEEMDVTRCHVRFFTSGAIFRPGQTADFKAIVYSVNNATAHFAPVRDHPFTVILAEMDQNAKFNKEFARLELRTNDYGSASGVFTLPMDKSARNYVLYSPDLANELGCFSVVPLDAEVATKPDFAVTLADPAITPRLGETVSLEGKAITNTGAPVAGAMVRWGVGRCENRRNPSASLAGGVTTTDATGKFHFTFTLFPEETERPNVSPPFHYDVSATVTDAVGELRAAYLRLIVGPAVLRARLRASEWQVATKPVTFTISTRSINGSIPQKSEGVVALYALRQPAEIIPPKALHSYAIHGMTASATTEWETGEHVTTQPFATDAKGKAELNIPLPVGAYRAMLTTRDQYGTPVEARTDIVVADPDATCSAHKVPFRFVVEQDRKPIAPGETFTALWSSGHTGARAHVTFLKNRKVFHQFWTDPGRSQQLITLPVTAQHQGGFTVQILQASGNRLYSQYAVVDVPFFGRDLGLTLENFSPKLVSGRREAWTLRINSPDDATGSPKSACEVVAMLYDASSSVSENYEWPRFQEYHGIFRKESYYMSDYQAYSANCEYRTCYVKNSFPESPFARNYYLMGSYPSLGFTIRSTKFPIQSRDFSFWSGAVIRWLDPEDWGKPRAAPPPANTTPKTSGGTVFFHPALVTGSDGTVRIEFTVPKALGRWRLLVFAHDQQLRSIAHAAEGVVVEETPVD